MGDPEAHRGVEKPEAVFLMLISWELETSQSTPINLTSPPTASSSSGDNVDPRIQHPFKPVVVAIHQNDRWV